MRRLALPAVLAAAVVSAAVAGASETVSLTVRPLVSPTTAFGSISSGTADEKVTVQFEQCGLYPVSFRDVKETTTSVGGNWTVDVGAPTNGRFRAVSGGAVSNVVKVQARPDVRVTPHGGRSYEVVVRAALPFWRKHVLLQRFDRGRAAWVLVRRLVLERTFGPGIIWSTTDRFTVKLPKGTTIRAVLPRAQAGPCYLAGYSKVLRT